MSEIKKTIAKIKAFMHKNAWSNYRMCKEAGLHVNTLHRIKSDDWSPRVETIAKIEQVIKKYTRKK